MIGFRVTDQMLLGQVISNLQQDSQALDQAEQVVSTGHIINKPSDNPFGAAQAVSFRQRIGLNTQLQSNLTAAQGWLQATDSGLGSMASLLQRARELALQGANDTMTASDRQKIATEVHQLMLNAVDVGNSKFGGQYIFAGTKVTTQPFIQDGSATSPNISLGATPPVSYLGDTGGVTRQIDRSAQLQINVNGTTFSGMMNDLAQLEYDLNNSGVRVSGSVSGLDPVNGRTTGNPATVETFTINGVAIGTNQSFTVNGVAHTIKGFAPGTLLSTVVSQINTQLTGQVKASINSQGVLVLQSLTGGNVNISRVDQATVDAVTGADLTGGTGVPVSTGGNTAKDLGLTVNVDNAIGSADVFALDTALATISTAQAQVGAKTNRVTEGLNRLSGLGVTLQQLDASVENADMAKAISNLATIQTTFQAALAAAAKVLPPTLFSFLH